jgi:FtsH-binding integral membrane protein
MVIGKATEEAKTIKRESIQKVSDLLTAAFGLVAALAWNTAIQEWFKTQTWLAAYGPWAYAIVVTIVAVIAAIWIGRLKGKIDNE